MNFKKSNVWTSVLVVVALISAASLIAHGGRGGFGGGRGHGGYGRGRGSAFGAGLLTGAIVGGSLGWNGGYYQGRYYEPNTLCTDDGGVTWYEC